MVRRAREREAIRQRVTINSRGIVTGRIADDDELPYIPGAVSERTSDADQSGVIETRKTAA